MKIFRKKIPPGALFFSFVPRFGTPETLLRAPAGFGRARAETVFLAEKNILGADAMERKLTLPGLAAPIFVENFLNKLLTMVNVYLLSRLSQDAVAAIGVANQFLNFITMAFSFVTFGVAVVIAQTRGAGDEKRASEAATAAVVANVVFGLTVGLLLLLFHRPLLRAKSPQGSIQTDIRSHPGRAAFSNSAPAPKEMRSVPSTGTIT